MKKHNYKEPPDFETICRAVFQYDEEAICRILEHYQPICLAKIRARMAGAGLDDIHLLNDIAAVMQEKLIRHMERFH